MDIWSILIVVFIFQGIFVLFSILTSKNRKARSENRILVVIVLVLLWILLEFLSVRNKIDFKLSLFYGTRYGSWLLLGPLVFFYFRAITKAEKEFSKLDFLHFVPFVIFVIVLPLLWGNILNQRQIDYGMLSVFDHRQKIIAPTAFLYSYIFIAQFLSFVAYLVFSFLLIKDYSQQIRQEYAQIDTKVKWLRLFILSFIMMFVFTAVFLFLLLKTDVYRRYMDYLYIIPAGLLFYAIGYFLIDENWVALDQKRPKYANSTFDQDKRLDYVEKLETLIQEESLYLNPNIRLRDLAKRMDISSHHLSQLLNQHYHTSFFDYVNKYRIEKAKELIQKHPERILMHIAFDSGFNNKTSFVNAFKKFEKTTPSRFKEALSL